MEYTEQGIKNLIKLRDWLIQNKELVESHLDFTSWQDFFGEDYLLVRSNIYESFPSDSYNCKFKDCNTTMCLAGWVAHSKLFDQDKYNYTNYPSLINNIFFGGKELDSDDFLDKFYFLFSSDWPNDFNFMIERINYVIKYKSDPAYFCASELESVLWEKDCTSLSEYEDLAMDFNSLKFT